MNAFDNRNLIAPDKRELGLGAVCALMYLLVFPNLLALFEWEGLRGQVLRMVTSDTCSFVLILCVFWPFLCRSRCSASGLIFVVFWGYLAYYGISQLYAYVLSLLPLPQVNANQEVVVRYYYDDRMAMLFLSIVIAPVVEEVLVRGLIFAPLCKKKPLLAYVASMAAFAFLHIMGHIGAEGQTFYTLLYAFLQYLPAGFILGWAYQMTGSILAPIFLHSFCNIISIFLL